MASLGTAYITIRPDGSSFATELQGQVSAATNGVAQQASRLGSTLTRSLTLPIVGIGVAAGALAVDFELSFSRIEGLVGASKGEIEGYKEAVLSLAGDTTRAPAELAEALYFITSSGQSGAQALETLRVSARAAAAGLGDTQTVADTVTSAMNAYGPAALDAARATDILVAGVKEGKAEPAEFGAGLGNLAPLASQLGVSFEDLTATIASMTVVGVDADTAFTNVSAVLSGLLKTAPQSEKALESVGLSSAGLRDTISKPGGLVQALRDIDTAFGGNEEAMAAVFPNIRALRGVMSLLAQDSGKVDDVFREVTNSTGGLDRAFGAFEQTSAAKFQRSLTDLKTAGIGLGNELLPIGTKIAGFGANIGKAFAGLPDSAQNMILLSAAAAAALGPLLKVGGAIGQLGSTIGAGGFSGNFAKAGLAMTAFSIAAATVGPSLTEATGSAEIAGAAMGAITGLSFGPWGAVAGGVLGAVAGHFGLLGDTAADAAAKASAAVDKLTDSLLKNQAAVAAYSTDQITQDWREAGESAEEALPALDKAGISFEDLNRSLQGGPVVMDAWIQGIITAAGAAGATEPELIALAETLGKLAPKWIEANSEAAKFADIANDSTFFANQFNSNMQLLAEGLPAATAQFQQFGTVGAGVREQLINAGVAAGQFGMQLIETGVPIDQVTGQLQGQVDALVGVGTQMGMTEGQAIQYTASLLGIPPDVATGITNTADLARALVDVLLGRYAAIPETENTTVTAETAAAEAALLRVAGHLARLQDKNITVRVTEVLSSLPGGRGALGVPRQHGGPIPGPRGREVLVRGHGGEFVLDPGTVDAIKKGKQSAGAATGGAVMTGGGTTIIIAKSIEEAITRAPAGSRATIRAHLERRN